MHTTTLNLERLTLDNLRLQLNGCELRVRHCELTGPTLTLAGPRLQSLQAAQARLGATDLVVPADALAAAHGAPRAAAWRLEPLSNLEGRIQALITDAHWTLDADVTVPVHEGRVDFNEVTVEHVGPDSSMGISPMGIYVDAPNGRTYLYLFSVTHVPGARFEKRGGSLFGAGISDRGALELRPFVEALLAGVVAGDAPHPVEAQLDRTRMSGTLELGDGLLGTDGFSARLAGHARGMNRASLSAAVVGHEVAARVPELYAESAALDWQGFVVRCETVQGAASLVLRPSGITLQAQELALTGLSIERPNG